MNSKFDPEFPWEKQVGEPDKAWAAFTFFRDLGPDRTLRAVAQHEGKSESLMKQWSAKHGWVARVDAYERHLDRRSRAELERGRLDMSKRHAQLAIAVQSKIAARLASLDPSELGVKDVAYWLEISTRLERISRGLPAGESGMAKLSAEMETDVKSLSADERRELLAQTLRTIAGRVGEQLEDDEDA